MIFVSHNMGAVRSLCRGAIVLDRGLLLRVGPVTDVIAEYLSVGSQNSSTWTRAASISQTPGIYLTAINVFVADGETTDSVSTDESFEIEVIAWSNETYRDAEIAIRFTNQDGIPVLTTTNADTFDTYPTLTPGKHAFRARVPAHLLSPGTYYLLVAALIPQRVLFDSVENEVSIKVDATGPQAHAKKDYRLGVVNPILTWSHVYDASLAPPAAAESVI